MIGALNEPLATPGQVWIVCVWQFDGQCWMRSVHESADAGSVPCSGSVAWPVNEIGSPTFQVSVEAGVSMTGSAAGSRRAVVNAQLTSAASGLPATSFAPPGPPLTVAV